MNKERLNSLLAKLKEGDRFALSKAITIVENSRSDMGIISKTILNDCFPFSGKSFRIGISGAPGAGKSAFIEALGSEILKEDKKIAVLAIDPSSAISDGSILGDKTRMEELSRSDRVFIRPSPAGKTLGGIAKNTSETILLCEAAGYEIIFVETVGVGQSEYQVRNMVDFFVLLQITGAGDELQGIKRGILEMTDAIVINKSDGENIHPSNLLRKKLKSAMHYLPPKPNGWVVPVDTCSSIERTGIPRFWNTMQSYLKHVEENGAFHSFRQQQQLSQFDFLIKDEILLRFLSNPTTKELIQKKKQEIKSKSLTVTQAVDDILNELGLYSIQYENRRIES